MTTKILLIAATIVAVVLVLTLAPTTMTALVAWVAANLTWIAVGLAIAIIVLIFVAKT